MCNKVLLKVGQKYVWYISCKASVIVVIFKLNLIVLTDF